MSELVIKSRFPISRHISKGLDCPNSLRVYRQSPSDGYLQLRRENDFTGISMSAEDCRLLANKLIQIAMEIETRHVQPLGQ